MQSSWLWQLLLFLVASGVSGYVSISISLGDSNSSLVLTHGQKSLYDTSFSIFLGIHSNGFLYLPDSEDYCVNATDALTHSNVHWFIIYETFPSCLDSIVKNLSNHSSYRLILTSKDDDDSADETSNDIMRYKFPIVVISEEDMNHIIPYATSDSDNPEEEATISADNNLFIIVAVLLSLAVLVVVCIAVCLCGCVVIRYCNRATYQHLADRTLYAQRPLGSRKTSQLPIRKYLEQSSEEVCAICRDVLRSGDPVKVLPCGHSCFHPECISAWLVKRNNKCPLCRNKVTVKKRFTYTEGYGMSGTRKSSNSENPYLLAREGSQHYGLSVNST